MGKKEVILLNENQKITISGINSNLNQTFARMEENIVISIVDDKSLSTPFIFVWQKFDNIYKQVGTMNFCIMNKKVLLLQLPYEE